jgi:hypothetical protein
MATREPVDEAVLSRLDGRGGRAVVSQNPLARDVVDPVLADLRLELADLRRQLGADVGLDRLPRPDGGEPLDEVVRERLCLRRARLRLRATTTARDERGEDERRQSRAGQAAAVCSCFR